MTTLREHLEAIRDLTAIGINNNADVNALALAALDLMNKSGIDVLRSGWTEDEQRKPTYRSIQEPWRDPRTPETEAMKCRICDGSAQCKAVVHIEGCFAGSLS